MTFLVLPPPPPDTACVTTGGAGSPGGGCYTFLSKPKGSHISVDADALGIAMH